MVLKTKPVKIFNPDRDAPLIDGAIPVLDGGVRGNPSITHDSRGLSYGDEQYAFEKEVDAHIVEFIEALQPFADFLKEEGLPGAWKIACNAALTRRNQMSKNASRIEGAKMMSAMTPRYRALRNAAKAQGASIEIHTYSHKCVNVIYQGNVGSAIVLRDDGWYTPAWSDGYHVAEDEGRLGAEQAMQRAIEITHEGIVEEAE